MGRISVIILVSLAVLSGTVRAQVEIDSNNWPYGMEWVGNRWEWYLLTNQSVGHIDFFNGPWDFSGYTGGDVAWSEIRPIGEATGDPPPLSNYAEKGFLPGTGLQWVYAHKVDNGVWMDGGHAAGVQFIYENADPPPSNWLYKFPLNTITSWTSSFDYDVMGFTRVNHNHSAMVVAEGEVTVPQGGPYQALVIQRTQSIHCAMGFIDEDRIVYEWVVPNLGSVATIQSQNKETNPNFTVADMVYVLKSALLNEQEPPQIANTTIWGNVYYQGPYLVSSEITDASGIARDSLYYNIGGAGWASVSHDSVVGATYYFTIPGVTPGATYPVTINYYISAVDGSVNSNRATDPAGAPGTFHSFDVLDPALDHTSPQITATTQWADTGFAGPYFIETTVIDSSHVGDVFLWYKIGGAGWSISLSDSVSALLLGGTYYFHIPSVIPPAEILYYIEATDASPNANMGHDPPGAPDTTYSFMAQDVLGPEITETTNWGDIPHTGFGPFPVRSHIVDMSGIEVAYMFYKLHAAPWESTLVDSVIDDWHWFTIPAIQAGVIRYYLKAVDASPLNNVSFDPPDAPDVLYQFIPTGIEEIAGIGEFSLICEPNPFSRELTIRWSVPNKLLNQYVSLRIYDISGRPVRTFDLLADQYQVIWDGRDDRGNELSSGIYFSRLESGDKKMLRKIILMR